MTDTFASEPSSHLGGSSEDPQPASDVTGTLAELERKLRELEHELTSIGRRRSPIEDQAPPVEEPVAVGAAAGDTAGRLIDEAVERSEPLPPSAPLLPPTGQAPSPGLAGLAELRLFRERLEGFARELIEDYEQVLERVMGDFSSAQAPAPTIEDTLFEGPVELGVGPFYDIASLGAFERQVARVPHASDVAVRRFEASHAVLDLNLNAPVALIRELRAQLDTGFSVREIAGARLLLTFDDI